MNETLQEIITAALKHHQTRTEPTHPQYIRGTFYVTHDQYIAIRDYALDRHQSSDHIDSFYQHPEPLSGGVNGIPLVILNSGDTVVREDGSILLCHAEGKRLCSLDPHIGIFHNYSPPPIRSIEMPGGDAYIPNASD